MSRLQVRMFLPSLNAQIQCFGCASAELGLRCAGFTRPPTVRLCRVPVAGGARVPEHGLGAGSDWTLLAPSRGELADPEISQGGALWTLLSVRDDG